MYIDAETPGCAVGLAHVDIHVVVNDQFSLMFYTSQLTSGGRRMRILVIHNGTHRVFMVEWGRLSTGNKLYVNLTHNYVHRNTVINKQNLHSTVNNTLYSSNLTSCVVARHA